MADTDLIKWINTLVEKNNMKTFYNSTLWKHKRLEVLKEQHCECQHCKKKGIFVPADTVHHVKFLRKHPSLALSNDNLLALCNECHYEIHHNKPKTLINTERW